MRPLAEFVMRSRLHAVGMTALLAYATLLLPPFGYLTGAVVGLVTLRHGGLEGILTLIGGLVLVTALNRLTGGTEMMIGVLALFWLPVWVVALLLRSSHSLKVAIQVSALFGVAALFLFYLVADGNPSLWWQNALQAVLTSNGELGGEGAEMALDPRIADVLTGVLAAGFFLGLVIMVLIARSWQAMLYNPGGLKQEFLALQLGKNSVFLGLAVMLPGMLMGDEVPTMVPDLIQIWMTLFMLQGLSVAHALLDMRKMQRGWVVGLYLVTLFTPLGFIVTMVGVTDGWVNFRKQFAV